jgi:pimeloyl-ACP methyl ester carboxylesterase
MIRLPRRPAARPLLVGAAALAVMAVGNTLAALWTERRHPPEGRFIEVDGVRLHYSDRGTGSPVVLIHGNAVTGDDFDTSGVAARLLPGHRVIIFDRPGFGHSARPRGRLWTATEQADLLHAALRRLGVARPVVVGHSWGAIAALALAVRHQADIAGLVLVSGYYFWTLRPDVLLDGPAAIPVLGDILRYTLSPVVGWLTMPLLRRLMFTPAPVTPRFRAEYSAAMALRPWQIRATAMDGVLMIPGALALRRHYRDLTLPVVILAGDGDKVVFPGAAERLQAEIPGSVLHIIEGAGHMVHHLVPERIVAAVAAVAAQASAPAPSRVSHPASPSGVPAGA